MLEGIPILMIKFNDLVWNDKNLEACNVALTFCLLVIKKFMMCPHYCEKYNLLVDLSNLTFNIFKPCLGTALKLKDLFVDNFNGCSNMTIIYNAPK